jgi:hypothetical protein
MYDLYLTDGIVIHNVRLLKPNKLLLPNDINNQWYYALNDFNLSIAYLCKDDIMEKVYIDYARKSYVRQIDGTIEVILAPWDEVNRIPNSWTRKENKKKKGETKK